MTDSAPLTLDEWASLEALRREFRLEEQLERAIIAAGGRYPLAGALPAAVVAWLHLAVGDRPRDLAVALRFSARWLGQHQQEDIELVVRTIVALPMLAGWPEPCLRAEGPMPMPESRRCEAAAPVQMVHRGRGAVWWDCLKRVHLDWYRTPQVLFLREHKTCSDCRAPSKVVGTDDAGCAVALCQACARRRRPAARMPLAAGGGRGV